MEHFRVAFYLITQLLSLTVLMGSIVHYIFKKERLSAAFVRLLSAFTLLSLGWLFHAYSDAVGMGKDNPFYRLYIFVENTALCGLIWVIPSFGLTLFHVKKFAKLANLAAPALALVLELIFLMEFLKFVRVGDVLFFSPYQLIYMGLGLTIITTIVLGFVYTPKEHRKRNYRAALTLGLMALPSILFDVLFPAFSQFILLSPLIIIAFLILVLFHGIDNLSGLKKASHEVIRDHFQTTIGLSHQEKEVFPLLVNGTSLSGISENLMISLDEAQRMVRRIYQKAGAQDLDELRRRFLEYQS